MTLSSGRGIKRPLHPDWVQQSGGQQDKSKRRRIDESPGGFSAFKFAFSTAFATVRRFFFGMADSEAGGSRSGYGNRNPESDSDSDEVQYLGQTIPVYKVSNEEHKWMINDADDEVQLIKVENHCNPNRDQGRLGARKKGILLNVASSPRGTKGVEKQSLILKRLKERHPSTINFARNFNTPAISASGSKKYFLNSKDESTLSPNETGRRIKFNKRRNISDYIRMDELDAYKELLNSGGTSLKRLQNPLRTRIVSGLNNISPASPLWSSTPFRSGAITKVQLSFDEKKKSNLEKRAKGKSSPEVIDLENEEPVILSEKITTRRTSDSPTLLERPRSKSDNDDVIEIIKKYATPPVTASGTKIRVNRINTLEEELKKKQDVTESDSIKKLLDKYNNGRKERELKCREAKAQAEYAAERRNKLTEALEKRIKESLAITEVAIDEVEEEEEEQLPEITDEMRTKISWACNSRGEVLIEAFNIPISRKDVETLQGLNWLNDEVINFYLQMICERSAKHDNWPKVYAFNTFFYPKIMDQGQKAVRRWTRKVDIFSYDVLLVPVHLGMHWCLGVINLKKKGVYYYDSMGGNNKAALNAFLKYLQDEHQDKKGSPFDTSDFEKVIVKNIPQQMNGSDCGMFTCKFAEYISRDAPITFTQDDMPYFRQRMIYEIVTKGLMHP